jgi:hypothetical protein
VSFYRLDAENKQFGVPEVVLAQRPWVLDSVLEKIQGHSINYEKSLPSSIKIYGNSNDLRSNILAMAKL